MLSKGEQKRIEYFNVPNKIRTLRIKVGSQGEVAEKVGLSRIHFGNIEKGLKQTTEDTAIRIAETLGTKVSTIFKKTESNKFIAK